MSMKLKQQPLSATDTVQSYNIFCFYKCSADPTASVSVWLSRGGMGLPPAALSLLKAPAQTVVEVAVVKEAGAQARQAGDMHGRLVPELQQQLSRACRGSPAALGGRCRNVPQLLMPLVLSSPEAAGKMRRRAYGTF